MPTASRLGHLRRRMAETGIDAILIYQSANRLYLSGFDGSAGSLFITEKEAVLATDFRYVEQAKAQAPGFQVFRTGDALAGWLPELLSGTGTRRLGFEAEHVSFDLHRRMKGALDGLQIELVPADGLVEALRAVKDPAEIELICRAAAIADAAFGCLEDIIRPGITEEQFAWETEKRLREKGSQSLPFEIIIASGPNAALPHARPSSRVINSGEPVVIDMGARCGGYCSDLSRTIWMGDPDATFEKVYNTVLDAQLAAMSIIKGGVSGGEADAAARKVIQDAGYGDAFGHGLGHGVGLETHEAPRLGPGSADVLVPGMVFTVEPGVYLPGWGGVRIEDLVLLGESGLRVISGAKKARYDKRR